MFTIPLTAQPKAALARLTRGLAADVWVLMDPQPHHEVIGFNETGEGVFRPRLSRVGCTMSNVRAFQEAIREVDCPVKPGDTVGFREEFSIGLVSVRNGKGYVVVEYRDGFEQQVECGGPDAALQWDIVGPLWQTAETMPEVFIRHRFPVTAVDVGRPVDASEEACKLAGASCENMNGTESWTYPARWITGPSANLWHWRISLAKGQA